MGVRPARTIPRNTERAETHIRRLAIAQRAAAFAACPRVILQLSGLDRVTVARLFPGKLRPGRFPSASAWLPRATLLALLEAAILAATYERMRLAGHPASTSMIEAYAHLVDIYYPLLHSPDGSPPTDETMLSFDRAFDVLSTLAVPCPSPGAEWVSAQPTLRLHTCRACGSRYIVEVWATDLTRADCPMCKFVHRLRFDRRIRFILKAGEAWRDQALGGGKVAASTQ